ncbi:glycoside hydrolase family 88 protein [uncultured Bacteroides sp.]|uniref:glycoside hydrolase family 88 protein n=1 Tax=uncultured Bacteroides sp. TaxID=162156 RepID=UPI0025D68608|nr:glycoside hydrolase family 88 protein [uncultured Bacteroides sp.]
MSLLAFAGCKPGAATAGDLISDNVRNAAGQYSLMAEQIEESGRILNPRTLDKDGKTVYVPYRDWTSGFFPGSMWHLYHLTGDKKWEALAVKYTEAIDSVQYVTWHHDVGFMAGCSFLNGMRLGGRDYGKVIVRAAESLSTRFRPNAGVIQSWNVDRGWQSERGWKCPVIIDNMMNLELLFEATRLSGDSTYYNMAVSHADRTLKNHYREDYSCYHVVDYDPESGEVRGKQTAQGYADESAWARGQAWGLYGYTMCYRYTRKPEYLAQARRIYDFIFTHPNLPKDLVPYWDYDALNIPNVPRDASAAAITASALYELDAYLPESHCCEVADKIVENLSSAAYRAKAGTNGNFILMHSVGALPMGAEVDVPLNYADYYFLEALKRKKDGSKQG